MQNLTNLKIVRRKKTNNLLTKDQKIIIAGRRQMIEWAWATQCTVLLFQLLCSTESSSVWQSLWHCPSKSSMEAWNGEKLQSVWQLYSDWWHAKHFHPHWDTLGSDQKKKKTTQRSETPKNLVLWYLSLETLEVELVNLYVLKCFCRVQAVQSSATGSGFVNC